MNLTYRNNPVEIVETYPLGPHAVPYATVKAVEGAPFVGGTHYPVRSPYAVVPLAEIDEPVCTCPDDPNYQGMLCPVCREYLAEMYQDELPY